jgi:hypothetical protein
MESPTSILEIEDILAPKAGKRGNLNGKEAQMKCKELCQALGMECEEIDEKGRFVAVLTDLCFEDGDGVPVYVETRRDQIRFFDDRGVTMQIEARDRYMAFLHEVLAWELNWVKSRPR